MKVFRNLALGLIIFFVCVILFLFSIYQYMLSPVSEKSTEIKLEITSGTSTAEIIELLKENNLIRSKVATKIYVKLKDIHNLKASVYTINKNMSNEEIFNILQKGNSYNANEIKVTFPEGKTMRGIAKIISNNTNNTDEDVFNLLNNIDYIDSLVKEYTFLPDIIKNSSIYYPLEGYLFPETYYFENKDVTVDEIFKTMLNQTKKLLNDNAKLIQNSKYSIHEIMTLASVTQSEGLNNDDMKNVASVFLNRLEKNMSLGSCVTTYYAAKVDMGTRDLYTKEINMESPYNTRGPKMDGKLPIGPISNPGKAAIMAVLDPTQTNYLYFVSDKNRDLYFTKTYTEHNNKIQELKNKGLWYEW